MTQVSCECECGQTPKKKGSRFLRGHQIRVRPDIQLKGQPKGEQSAGWKGGRVLNWAGYVMLKMHDHPLAQASGYVFEHRKVASEKIGRLLTRRDVVHHINGIKTDNRPENLMVVSRGEHMRIEHGEGYRVKDPSTRREMALKAWETKRRNKAESQHED